MHMASLALRIAYNYSTPYGGLIQFPTEQTSEESETTVQRSPLHGKTARDGRMELTFGPHHGCNRFMLHHPKQTKTAGRARHAVCFVGEMREKGSKKPDLGGWKNMRFFDVKRRDLRGFSRAKT